MINCCKKSIIKINAHESKNENFRLILVSIDGLKLDEVENKCIKAGSPEVLVIACDLSQEADCTKAVNQTILNFKELDILISSAGIVAAGNIENHKLEDYDRCMAINTRAPFIITQQCLPHLIKTKGSIVYVSSVLGIRCSPASVAYGMSKAAIDNLTRTVALWVGEHGVRVNSVNPGPVSTPLLQNSGMTEEERQSLSVAKETLLGRVATSEEISKTIVFLASSDSAFTTGQNIVIDGGQSLIGVKPRP